ncbi:MAG: nucleoside-diphosphate sugar epimerase/dehydratase [Dehalococcoidia bacterium]
MLVILIYAFSFLLRYDFQLDEIPLNLAVKTLPLLVVVRMGTIGLFHMFQGLWRYINIRDLIQVIRASTAGTVVFVPLVWLIFDLTEFPIGVFVLDLVGNVLVLSGVRVLGRLAREAFKPPRRTDPALKRLLVVGAGDAGATLCAEAWRRPEFGFIPVGFIDDDPWKSGAALMGIPILGTRNDIPQVAAQYSIDTIIIAIPSASREQMRGILEQCRQAKVSFRTLPSVTDILDGKVSISLLREVEIADLLGREPVELDREVTGSFLHGKRILITGAAGSIGSELARQIATFQPEMLILIDRAENPLFYFDAEFQRMFPGQPFVAEIRDVCDCSSIRGLMETYKPQLVFHAAAHKHVPLMERTAAEAVRNNILGTQIVASLAQENDVEKFVLISTDKAVNPTSVMGATKRVAELLVQDMNGKGPTRFISVRFGNVLGSNASVVPVFKEQIAKGGPVTVTHPEARRYFMTVPEAAQLVMQAGAIGSGGEVFVLDMGEPLKILDLARDLISLAGYTPDKDIKIVFTGLRPGEKLFEELTFEREDLLATDQPKLKVLRDTSSGGGIEAQVARLAADLPALTSEQVRAELHNLIPEYAPAPESQSPTPAND